MQRHGECSHYYCDYCTKKEQSVETLEEACEIFNKFNAYEYASHKKELKGDL